MRSQNRRTHPEWSAAVVALAAIVASLAIGGAARGDERKFAVMLAHSPKSFTDDGYPGLPEDGLIYENEIRVDYFDPDNDPAVRSFREFWAEVSYGDVTVTGEVFPWIYLPWAFEVNGPHAADRASPEDYIDLRTRN